ncbi:High-affinity branched-chain amino acid transport system permease protein LivH [Pigmentiphaga humi]|uniref:High-affinity branched-chain amino acid transport system permease protein LivH n=1 Tax=Pigmentiphaga humi TaxID=2478468 RepID=A0A3P4B871_9BURK|nr:ABC transporter permease [Pigmentiphaga humi]VCU72529.1 High-affinity branched-chain amino acid transport system permease protein LivH [Pigmentiphaga humi]
MLAQLLNGLASASSLFLLSLGLTLIFGVSRVVNFAHGSLAMLGLYLGVSLAGWMMPWLGGAGFWGAVAGATVAVALVGALVERLLLRRLYGRPELFQLVATFALVLIVRDATLWFWGADDLLGPKAPGLDGVFAPGALNLPWYDLALMAAGVAVLAAVRWVMASTRWGLQLRAATEDREMALAIGVDERRLFTQVFALGAGLAGLAGALQMPREPAALTYDLQVVAEAFVVTVVGGMGSVAGAFVAAMLIGVIKAACVALGTLQVGGFELVLPKLTLVIEFLLMAVVLAFRPWGLFGRPAAPARAARAEWTPLPAPAPRAVWGALALLAVLAALPWMAADAPYVLVLAVDVLIAGLFAASLFALMGPGGIHSFGHAAFLGLGAYGAALAAPLLADALPGMEGAGGMLQVVLAMCAGMALAVAGAALYGFVVLRAAGVYAAMLTLAFAQITWSIAFQWDGVTGGSNGLFGFWPQGWLGSREGYYWFVLGIAALAAWLLRQVLHAPFGVTLRMVRDAPLRAESLGLPVFAVRWTAFMLAGALAGAAGALTVFAKGSLSPDLLAIPRSVDALVMVLLGGLQSLAGPWLGALAYTVGQDFLARATEYWRAAIGFAMLVLVLLAPGGLTGWRWPAAARRQA